MKNVVILLCIFWCAACQPTEGGKTGKTQVSPKPVATTLDERPTGKPGSRNADELAASGFKRYGIEKGVFHFRIYGAVKGYEVIYFDHWGWREGKYVRTETDIAGYQEKTDVVQYLDGERRYEYRPETHTANYFDSPQVQASADKYQTLDMVKVGEEMLKKMGAVRTGTEEFQGVVCDVWEIEKYRTTLHMWQGLTMKETSFVNNIPITRTCILLETGKEVAVEKMTLPAGATTVKTGGR